LKQGWSVKYEVEYKNSRARSIKTRIETFNGDLALCKKLLIREQDPLKQGLKPFFPSSLLPLLSNSRARSIKTRIETEVSFFVPVLFFQHSRARSIKTRIETKNKIAGITSDCDSRARSIKTRIETENGPHIRTEKQQFESKIH